MNQRGVGVIDCSKLRTAVKNLFVVTLIPPAEWGNSHKSKEWVKIVPLLHSTTSHLFLKKDKH